MARMHKSVDLTELDLSIVHALQLAPRAPWNTLGEVLGVDHTTVARHWARLEEQGSAWLMAYYPAWHDGLCRARVEVDCAGGTVDAVAQALVHDPHVVSVDLTHNGGDLQLMVSAGNLGVLSRYVTDRLHRLPGVERIAVHPVTREYADGRQWRLDALDAEQVRQLTAISPAPHGGTVSPGPEELRILSVLGPDGRCSWTQLAERTKVSAATVRRKVHRMMREGTLAFRCEVAAHSAGWPVQVLYTAQCPANRLESAARELVVLPGVRSVAALAGPANLAVTAWLRSAADIQQLEVRMLRRVQELVITRRSVALRALKRMGRLLGADGRRIGYVPMDVWSDPVCGGSVKRALTPSSHRRSSRGTPIPLTG